MTIPIERSYAVRNTEEFLYSLLDKKRTPRVPMEIRRQARSLLKHFPGQFYMDQTREKVPEIWGDPHRKHK